MEIRAKTKVCNQCRDVIDVKQERYVTARYEGWENYEYAGLKLGHFHFACLREFATKHSDNFHPDGLGDCWAVVMLGKKILREITPKAPRKQPGDADLAPKEP